MKTYKAGTEVKVLGDWGYGTRVKHGIVTSVTSQDSLMARIGHTTPVAVRRAGKFFEYPSGSARTVTTPSTGAAGA